MHPEPSHQALSRGFRSVEMEDGTGPGSQFPDRPTVAEHGPGLLTGTPPAR